MYASENCPTEYEGTRSRHLCNANQYNLIDNIFAPRNHHTFVCSGHPINCTETSGRCGDGECTCHKETGSVCLASIIDTAYVLPICLTLVAGFILVILTCISCCQKKNRDEPNAQLPPMAQPIIGHIDSVQASSF